MDFDKYFFWLKWLGKIVWEPFWWIILMAVVLFIPFLRPWWWIFLPLFLSIELRTLYLWWINWDFNYSKVKWMVLEIIPPKEILIPLKAMEDVFNIMWGPLYDNPTWREKWGEGILSDASGWMSWEIVSIEGNLHFYLRIPMTQRVTIEAILYNHYPEMEIHEVPDYTKNVPQNVPNDEWNLYGEDFVLTQKPAYPIKTYEKFFEPQGERISAEEKRIDPLTSLLESMSRLGPGEQYWMQFITMPVLERGEPEFKHSAEKIINKKARRPEAKKQSLLDEILGEFYNIITGPQKVGSGEKATYKWLEAQKTESGESEMVITPGEREIITEVENKLKKPIYRTNIKAIYIAKRENFDASHRLFGRVYLGHFGAQNLNSIIYSKKTRTKVHYIFRKRRVFLRARRLLRNAVLRFPPLFPNRRSECAIFNTEELATLYHFPLKISGLVSPTLTRIESKKGGPPPNLPVE